MAVILWLVIALVPLILGAGSLRICNGKKCYNDMRFTDAYLTGILLCIGLAGAVHVICIFMDCLFSDFVRWFGIVTAAAVIGMLLGLVIGRGKGPEGNYLGRKAFREGTYTAVQQGVFFMFGLLVVLQAVVLLTGQSIYREGDMTLETVNTFLASNRIWEVNPLTGQAYDIGVPMRIKILVLPSLYGALCKISGVPVQQLVGQWIPVIVLLGGYFAYSRLARVLFGADASKRGIFLLVVVLLFCAGTYMDVMDGFGVLFAGYRGTTIRNVILVPYTICNCLQGKWKSVLLCILAEACIVWTLYGMGICLLTAVLFLGVHLYQRRFPGKEAVCRSS